MPKNINKNMATASTKLPIIRYLIFICLCFTELTTEHRTKGREVEEEFLCGARTRTTGLYKKRSQWHC